MPSVIMHTTQTSQNNVPAFLMKLWRLVEEKSCDDLICWSSGGTTFYIRDQSRFAKELLPLYFKHNNMASFIRQLNMFNFLNFLLPIFLDPISNGFRKVVNIEQGGLRPEKDEYEFQHMYFLKGHEYLLELIKRKLPTGKGQQPAEEVKPETDIVGKILLDVKQLHGKQENMDVKLATMKSENEVLWREVANLRQQHKKQQQIVNKLIQFLLSLVHAKRSTPLGLRRKLPLMLNDVSHSAAKSPRFSRSFSVDTNGKTEDRSQVQESDGPSLQSSTIAESTSPSGPVIHEITDNFDAEAFFNKEMDSIPTVASPFFIGGVDAKRESEAVASTSSEEPVQQSEELSSDALMTGAIEEVPSTENAKHLNDVVSEDAVENTVESPSGSKLDTESFKASDILVPVADKDLNKFEFEDHLNSLQLELDTLKDFLSGSGCTIDPVSFLGVCPSPFTQLFTNEDNQSKGMTESLNDFGHTSSNGSEIVGTEVAQYNPSSLGLSDDGTLFDSESILPHPLEDTSYMNDPLLECINCITDESDNKAIESPVPAEEAVVLESNADDDAILLSIPEPIGETLYPTDSNEDIVTSVPVAADQLPAIDNVVADEIPTDSASDMK